MKIALSNWPLPLMVEVQLTPIKHACEISRSTRAEQWKKNTLLFPGVLTPLFLVGAMNIIAIKLVSVLGECYISLKYSL